MCTKKNSFWLDGAECTVSYYTIIIYTQKSRYDEECERNKNIQMK